MGYRKESLLQFNQLPRTPIESIESIDQSRIIENDFQLISVPFKSGYPGINDKREEIFINDIFNKDSKQKAT